MNSEQEKVLNELCTKVKNGEIPWYTAAYEFKNKFFVSITYMLDMGIYGTIKKLKK